MYGQRIGYDLLEENDTYFLTTDYHFSTFQLAKTFQKHVDKNYCVVFIIGDVFLSSSSKEPTINAINRPVFSSLEDALADLEDMIFNKEYMFSHQLQTESLDNMKFIQLENKLRQVKALTVFKNYIHFILFK